jgi:hypothetical protein
MVWFRNFILECLHHHTFFNMFFDEIFEAHCAWIISCFGPKASFWLIVWPIFPSFRLVNIFHNALNITWIAPSLNCKYPSRCVHTSHWPYGYPFFMLCPWQQVHKNPWYSLQHLCCHLHRMLTSMWGENKYMCFFQTHSTFLIDELTLCSPKMAFTL